MLKKLDLKELDMEQVIYILTDFLCTQAAVAFLLHNKYAGAEFEFIYPSSWRSKCGIKNGRGIKRETAKAADIKFVEETFGLKVNDDIADAIGIGYSQIQNFSWGTK